MMPRGLAVFAVLLFLAAGAAAEGDYNYYPPTTLSQQQAMRIQQPNCPKPDNNCDTRNGESCGNCPLDCTCNDWKCKPGEVGANSWGCYDPCSAYQNAAYNKKTGKCDCKPGYVLNKDKSDCVRDIVCPPHSTVGADETCGCDEGYSNCDGNEVNGCETRVSDDLKNCGDCGNACQDNAFCKGGKCVCNAGYAEIKGWFSTDCMKKDCNNNTRCEPELDENCRKCPDCGCDDDADCDPQSPKADSTGCAPKLVCPDNSKPLNGKCLCVKGYADCDKDGDNGCETDVNSDSENCGGCRKACMENAECKVGKCLCQSGFQLNKAKTACAPFKCNDNEQCEAKLGERCGECTDCDCVYGSGCYSKSPTQKIKTIMDEDGCVECNKYCKATLGAHSLYVKRDDLAKCECDCDIGYMLVDEKCMRRNANNTAVIFVSGGMSTYENWVTRKEQDRMVKYYESLGYTVVKKSVNGRDDMIEELIKPETKAIAYFGHGGVGYPEGSWIPGVSAGHKIGYLLGNTKVSPSMEETTAGGFLNTKEVLRGEYELKGLPKDKALEKAAERESEIAQTGNFGLDHAYIFACFSGEDNSLRNILVRPGGTFWGHQGLLNPFESLTRQERPQ